MHITQFAMNKLKSVNVTALPYIPENSRLVSTFKQTF